MAFSLGALSAWTNEIADRSEWIKKSLDLGFNKEPMEKSIYILALKFGKSKLPNGITYNQLLEHLEECKQTPKEDFKIYFRVWFLKNFWVKGATQLLHSSPNPLTEESVLRGEYDNSIAVMTGEAFFKYQEYETLKQTRADAKFAQWTAIVAIAVSIAIGTIQIYQTNSPCNDDTCLLLTKLMLRIIGCK